MMTLVPLFFLFVWMLPADSMMVHFNFSVQRTQKSIRLSMAEDSVDDMYFGCQQEMEKVQKYYLEKEMKDNKFKDAWSKAANCSNKKPDDKDKALTKDHIHAICVYTRHELYGEFNAAVRKQGPGYKTTFKFHYLHFLLTSAVQILHSNNRCHTTYRRTNDTFEAQKKQIIRFGSFTSSSYRKDLITFGKKTCFKIQTCLGADLKKYPFLNDVEAEVLIPPYEAFKVAKKTKNPRKYEGLEDCKLLYELESVGIVSRLNCKAVNP